MLTKLQFVVDKGMIEELNGMGYKIVMTKEGYANSIKVAFNKLRNVNSKLESKRVELENMVKGKEVEAGSLNFGSMLAEISLALKFQVREDVLLCEYNKYVQLIRIK